MKRSVTITLETPKVLLPGQKGPRLKLDQEGCENPLQVLQLMHLAAGKMLQETEAYIAQLQAAAQGEGQPVKIHLQ